MFLVFLFFLLNYFFSFLKNLKLKVSSFESGFESLGKVNKIFSLHFFLLILIFVLFDLEGVLVFVFLLSG